MNSSHHQTTWYILLSAGIFLCLICTDKSFGQSHNTADGKIIFADNYFESAVQPGKPSKSDAAAIFYSALSTLVPAGIGYAVGGDVGISLIAAGVSIGPSVGILYAGDIDRAAMGLGVRSAGAAIAGVGALFYVFDTVSGDNRYAVGRTMVYGGLTLTVTSAIYDTLIAAPGAAKKYNRQSEPSLNPWVDPFAGSIGVTLNVNL